MDLNGTRTQSDPKTKTNTKSKCFVLQAGREQLGQTYSAIRASLHIRHAGSESSEASFQP